MQLELALPNQGNRDNEKRCRIVHGTPITPVRSLESLAGRSFCVSFAAPSQVKRCMALVGDDQILLLDNGAFSHWRSGRGRIDRHAFWCWANAIQAACSNAVAVIPDVIDGSEQENLLEVSWALKVGLARFPERTMAIWHMNESLEQLKRLCLICNFVGFGSCGDYDVQRNTATYLRRLRQANAVACYTEHFYGRRPWLHLMRALGLYHRFACFDSADSTNVARNHWRYRDTHGDAAALFLANRITDRIHTVARLARVHDGSATSNFAAADGTPGRT